LPFSEATLKDLNGKLLAFAPKHARSSLPAIWRDELGDV